jgi:hypothetical protein
VAQVAVGVFDPPPPAIVAIGRFHLLDAAELTTRGGPRSVDRQAVARVLGREQFKVRLDVGIEVVVAMATADQTEHSRPRDAEDGHDWLPSKRFRIETVRVQFCVSVASCFRPARVMA